MEDKIQMTMYRKEGKEYIATYFSDDPYHVTESLQNALIAKYLQKCTYIKSIKREQIFNGFIRVIVYYDCCNSKCVYIVKNV